MEELKNTDKKGISTKRKIGKTTYEVVVHFDENATETMQDKLTRIMLRELRRKSNEKKMILIKKSLTSGNRRGSAVRHTLSLLLAFFLQTKRAEQAV
ncbi:transposon-encoded TnpW family protein [Lancefieldella rimae]|uniref:transposon-encoded TnpW family protein n=2 Tax=Bacillati TaxID=1783272 RepID=UPI001CB1CFE3|nr:transposon-encoded TnpW family protein [Lancefieldella rimae]MBF4804131.1 transposon-encoded TnpW family protein [Lancefieldella rimae]